MSKLLINGPDGKEGIDPRYVLKGDWPDDIERSPIKAIRQKCIDCSGGSATEVKKCTVTGCALYPFRMGKNIFHSRCANPEGNIGPILREKQD